MIAIFILALFFFTTADTKLHSRTNASIISQGFIDSQTNFATSFYQEFLKSSPRKTNVVFSPLSIYMVLAMLRFGTAKESRVQMDSVMALSKIGNVGAELKSAADMFSTEGGTMKLFSKIWQQKYFCFSRCKSFTKKIQKVFHADLGEVHFAVHPREAANIINRWVFVKSRGRIEKLVKENEIARNTRFVLTNMVYFKANWQSIFVKKLTKLRTFTALSNGKRVRKYVETMFTHAEFRYSYGFGADYRLIELPYENNNFAMIIILPLALKDIEKVEKTLDFTVLNNMINRLQKRPKVGVDVFMPKFCVSSGLGLNNVLKGMGLTDIFDPSRADLSNISGFKGMYVSNIQHEAFIKVTEHGTEAAGGSSVTTGDLSLSDQFRVNRPFMFVIRHKPTNSIVFLGKVQDPSIQECNV